MIKLSLLACAFAWAVFFVSNILLYIFPNNKALENVAAMAFGALLISYGVFIFLFLDFCF